MKIGDIHLIKDDNEIWNDGLIYFGFPIFTMEFAPRDTKEDILDKSNEQNHLNQYLAVSLQINSYFEGNQKAEELTQRTIQQFNLTQMHRQGCLYPGKGVISIIKFNYKNNNVDSPSIEYFLTSENGCVTFLKWCPKYSQSEKEIGLLGMITSMGILEIASIPNHSNIKKQSFIENNIISKIVMEGVLFSKFDWITSQDNSIIGLGDQQGSIFIIKLLPQGGYDIIQYLANLHISEITSLEFYQHNDQLVPLLATGSYDGNVKILDPLQSCEPIFDLNLSSKGIIQIKWDIGGKYVNVIKDDLVNRCVLLSFFSIEKGSKSKEVGYTLQNVVDQRYLSSLAGSELILKQANSLYHKYSYFSSMTGKIYSTPNESIRKLAIKKEKKTPQHGKLFSDSQFDMVDGQLNAKLVFNTDYQEIIQSHQDEQVFNKTKRIDMTNRLSGFQVMSLCPNKLPYSETLLACASYLGIIRIHRITEQ